MCVILAKYFPDKGWVGVKNRDRNYTPEISFKIVDHNDNERLLFNDEITGYREGLNSHGVSILSASLMVLNDEKEVEKNSTSRSHDHSPDGIRISKALLEDNAVSAAKKCVELGLTGNTIIFDRENLFLLEASNRNNKFRYKIKKIPHDQLVARTNHGIWLPWAGYQRVADNQNQTLSRISSEARLIQAEAVVKAAKTPEDMIDGLCQVYVNHPQLNVMRTSTSRKKMRTTAQEMIIPSERTLYCRPISSHIKFDFWKLNRPNRNTWVEILSNRAIWQNTKGDPPFGSQTMTHS